MRLRCAGLERPQHAWVDGSLGCMHDQRHERAAAGVVEQPGADERKCHWSKEVERLHPTDECKRQMPAGNKQAKKQGGNERRTPGLEAR